MKITKRQLRRIIHESFDAGTISPGDFPVISPAESLPEVDEYQMSTPEQRRIPDAGMGTIEDAVRLLNGILDDWGNNPAMNHSEGDMFRMRVEGVIDLIEGVVGQQPVN